MRKATAAKIPASQSAGRSGARSLNESVVAGVVDRGTFLESAVQITAIAGGRRLESKLKSC
jgi:hypothetical protein